MLLSNLDVVTDPNKSHLNVTCSFQSTAPKILLLNLEVIPHPRVSQSPTSAFEGQDLSLEASDVFDELLFECRYDQGTAIKAAQVNKNSLECSSQGLSVGTHYLDVYSNELQKFIARDVTV